MTSTCLIALNKGLHTWVDVADLQHLCGVLWHATPLTWSHRLAHYAAGRPGHRTAGMHRWLLGVTVRHVDVDHINHDGLDNRRCNLRALTRSQNVMNRSRGRDAPLSLGILPPDVPIITRETLRAADPSSLHRLVDRAPISPRLAA